MTATAKPCKRCGSRSRAANGQCRPCKRIADRNRARAARPVSMPERGRKHLFIPDLQVKPGVPLNHLYWIAQYAMDKAVDVVVFAGDVYDLPSLSSYDKRGSKAVEGRRVAADMDAGDRAVDIIADQWDAGGFTPEVYVTLGNHEKRRDRAIDEHPHLLDGVLRDFRFTARGWRTSEFLAPVTIDGIRYSHFFPQSANGATTQTKRGAPNAPSQIRRQLCSATAGHQQGLDVAVMPTTDGLRRGLIAGSCYLHDEDYMGPLNNYWRGIVLKHNVRNGNYNLCEVDLGYLASKYSRLEPADGRKVA
jgi:hypothetical protein